MGWRGGVVSFGGVAAWWTGVVGFPWVGVKGGAREGLSNGEVLVGEGGGGVFLGGGGVGWVGGPGLVGGVLNRGGAL